MSGIRKRHPELLRFERTEINAVLLLAFVLALVLNVRTWFTPGKTVVDAAFELIFLFLGFLLAVFLHEGGHKYAASMQGYTTMVRKNGVGLIISVFLALYSRGIIPLIAPNLFRTDARPDLRLDKFYRYDNPKQGAIIAGGGILGTTLAIVLFNTLLQVTSSALFETLVLGCVLHGVYSLIPLELLSLVQLRFSATSTKPVTPGDGLHLWWAGIPFWIFAMSFMLLFGLLALWTSTISYVLTLILAAVVTWLFTTFIVKA